MDKNENEGKYFETLCADNWKELYRFVYYKVQNREEALDITQEAYARAMAYRKGNGEKVIDYSSYLRTISLNIIRDNWRQNKRRGKLQNIEEVSPEVMAVGDFTELAAERTILKEALSRLTPEQREVVELRIIKGYSVMEAAKIMARKEGTIRVLQYRAVKALSEILKESEGKKIRRERNE